MVIALDAGNIDDSNGEETVVFVFHDKTQTEKQGDNSNIHSFSSQYFLSASSS
jgi:hypothetical protein